MPQATCKYCEKKFTKRKKWQLFCKSKCRDNWHNLMKALAEVISSTSGETK